MIDSVPSDRDNVEGREHPSKEIPPELVDKIVGRRGRLHAYESIDPARTALVAIDLDVGSCAREPDLTDAAMAKFSRLASAVRSGGGTVAFVTSAIDEFDSLSVRLGHEIASQYRKDAEPGGPGTQLSPALDVGAADVHVTKQGASAFFPGRCDLDHELKDRDIQSVLIAGLVTNICCESSARDAVELGYQVTMVSDANVGHSFGLHEASLATFYRFFGDVRPVDDILKLIGPLLTVEGVPDAAGG